MNAKEILRKALKAWAAGDVAGTLDFINEHCAYTIHVDETFLPLAGQAEGREEIAKRFKALRETFEYILFRPMSFQGDESVARARCEFIISERRTGLQHSGKLSLVARIENGQIVELHEYHDARMLETFIVLANSMNSGPPDG